MQNEKKKIKGSKRGLTFSFNNKEKFAPGKKYRYIIDIKKRTIVIIQSEDGGNTVSRKISGDHVKSLIDIRSEEVRKIVSEAEYIEVSIGTDHIWVKIKSDVVIEISKTELFQMAAGAEEDTIFYSVAETLLRQSPTIKCDKAIKQDIPNVIRVISLFAGAGMLDYSFANDSKFQIVYAAEYNNEAIETYRQNIGSEIQKIDIRKLKGDMLPQADIIIGGPPCQPISAANRHEASRFAEHPEGDMFEHYIRLVRETHVKGFLIENVKELITAKGKDYMQMLKDQLPEFIIHEQIVKDSDIGGFTNRKRAIVIGSRIGDFQIPCFKLFPARTVKDALMKVDDTWPNANDVTKSSELVTQKISMVPEGGNWKDLPEKYWTKSVHSNMYRRLDRNKPAVTIANWRKYLLSPPKWDDSSKWDRILSVSEAAALQGLPKDFMFKGSISAMQQQVANGVTQAIGRFAREIIKSFFALNS